jgi:hypothetical protein
MKLAHRTWDVLRQRSLMVKSRSVYMPYERERTMSEVLQGAFVNLRPICGELLLRGDNSVLQELEDVLARNADVRLLATVRWDDGWRVNARCSKVVPQSLEDCCSVALSPAHN